MKINPLEAHDRMMHLNNQWDAISQGCTDCLKNVPDAITFPIYIFAHPRTIEIDEKQDLILRANFNTRNVPTTRFIWCPRVTKPKAQDNSFLFMGRKNSDIIQTIWLLPARELWPQYAPGKMTHHPDVWNSIQNFINCRERLEMPEKDGPTKKNAEEFKKIYAYEAQRKLKEKHLKNNLEII